MRITLDINVSRLPSQAAVLQLVSAAKRVEDEGETDNGPAGFTVVDPNASASGSVEPDDSTPNVLNGPAAEPVSQATPPEPSRRGRRPKTTEVPATVSAVATAETVEKPAEPVVGPKPSGAAGAQMSVEELKALIAEANQAYPGVTQPIMHAMGPWFLAVSVPAERRGELAAAIEAAVEARAGGR